MEKKVTKNLFDGTAKKYDSKHIKNLSKKVIASMHINDIEQYGITSEGLDAMGRQKFPVCRYRTQITIHGVFPEGFELRAGGYKNVFRNANGSLGVRYTAIDRDKKTQLFAHIQFAEPDFWRVENNSTDYLLYHQEQVTTAEQYQVLKARAAEINAALSGKVFANVHAYLSQAWGVVYGVIVLNITSFYQKDYGDILLAIISGHSRYNNITLLVSDYCKHVAAEKARKEAERKAWEAEYEQRRKVEEEKQRKAVAVAQKQIEEDARLLGFTFHKLFDCRNKSANIMQLHETYDGAEIRYLSLEGKNKITKLVSCNSNFHPVHDWRTPKQANGTTWRDVWVKEIKKTV